MTARGPVALVVAPVLAAAALAGLVAAVALRQGDAAGAFEHGAGALAAVGAVTIALAVRPAWPLSLGLALTVFSGHWQDMGIPVAFDRVLLLSGIVSALVRARARDREALRTEPVDWLLAVVAVYVVVSSLLAGTLDEHEARFALIDRLSLLGFALFFAAPHAFREARDRQVLLGTLVALGGYLGITALLETVGPEALVVPGYITDPAIGIHADRARGPFAEAAANGMMLFACGVAAAVAVATWRERRRRIAAGVVLALCGLGILFTLTRAAWLAGGIAAIVTLVATPETRRYVLYAAGAGVLGVLLAFATVPGLQARADERADDQYPLWDRNNSNAAALRMIAERPVLGFGWGRYSRDSAEYYRQSPDYPLTFVRNVHNVYLNNAVELGLLGALLWLAAVGVVGAGAVLRRGPPALRPWKIGVLALVVSYAVVAISTPLAFAGPTLLLWAWAGVAWGRRSAAPA